MGKLGIPFRYEQRRKRAMAVAGEIGQNLRVSTE